MQLAALSRVGQERGIISGSLVASFLAAASFKNNAIFNVSDRTPTGEFCRKRHSRDAELEA